MGYSNVIDLVGSVSSVYREKTKEYTDLRIALKTTTPLGWQTTIPCVYRFWKGEKIPRIRKGTWLGLFGTVRFAISPEGRQQAYVQMLNEPSVVLGKSDRIMLNEMVAGGCLHDFNREISMKQSWKRTSCCAHKTLRQGSLMSIAVWFRIMH